MSRSRSGRNARPRFRRAAICCACSAVTFLVTIAMTHTGWSKEPAKIRASFVQKDTYEDGGVRLEKIEKGLVVVQTDGTLTGEGTYHYSYRDAKMFQQGEVPVKLTGTIKDNMVKIYSTAGIEYKVTGQNQWGAINSSAQTAGLTLMGRLVDGKFHGITHKGDNWTITVTMEMIGNTGESDDQDEPDEPEPAADDAPLEPIPDNGDQGEPSAEFCKECAEVAEKLDRLKSEFAQLNAKLESAYAHLAGAQANIQSGKKRLMEAQEKWHANQRFPRLARFWQRQIDQANVAIKAALKDADRWKKEIAELKKQWPDDKQQSLNTLETKWANMEAQCAKCKN